MGNVRAVMLCVALGWWFGFVALVSVALREGGAIPGIWAVAEFLVFAVFFGGSCGAIVGGVCAPVFVAVFRRKSIDTTGAWLFLTISPCIVILHLAFPFYFASPTSIVVFLMACVGLSGTIEDQHAPEGCCGKCGYNLAGNISGVCPECGTPIPGAGSDGFE